ncbi:MAG: hypothetical protein J0H84_13795 [Rhizobiales bacterium]|nr:hypothetical protein [Hyphomicrobiales bacterium]
MTVPHDPIVWCLVGFIGFEALVCWLALRRVSKMIDAALREQNVATDLVRKFVALRSEVIGDKFASEELRNAVSEFSREFFRRKKGINYSYLLGRIDFDDPALAKYFRCILTGMFAQTYYRFEDGPAERYKLLNRLIEDQDHYDTACRLRLADELLAELRGPIAA